MESEAKVTLSAKKIIEGELSTYFVDANQWLTIDGKFLEDLIPGEWIGRRVRITIEPAD